MTVESVEVVFENIQLPFSLEEKSMPFGKAWSVCVCVCVCGCVCVCVEGAISSSLCSELPGLVSSI